MEPLSLIGTLGLAGLTTTGLRYLWRIAANEDTKRSLEAQVRIAEYESRKPANPVNYSPHTSVNYSPTTHITNASTRSADAALSTNTIEDEDKALPNAVDLSEVSLPSGRVLLGLGKGSVITSSPKELMHVGCIGATGSGKTNAARLVLSQLLAMKKADVYICNPHHCSQDTDSESGDWRLIEKHLAAKAEFSGPGMRDILEMISATIDERWQAKREGKSLGRPIILYIDELPAILDTVRNAMECLSTILRRGRAVGVYLLTLSQDLATKTLGKESSGAVRENFRTAIYNGGDIFSASLLLDISRKEISRYEADLGQGVALIRAHRQPCTIARIPLASNKAVYGLLGDGKDDMIELDQETAKPARSAVEHAETAFSVSPDIATIVRRLKGDGQSKRNIIPLIWGCKPGGSAAYKEASAIYDKIVEEATNLK